MESTRGISESSENELDGGQRSTSVGRAAVRDVFKFAVGQLVVLLTFFHPLFTGIICTKATRRSCRLIAE